MRRWVTFQQADEIDDKVGYLKLQSMGIEIDTLTQEQYNYIHGFLEGT